MEVTEFVEVYMCPFHDKYVRTQRAVSFFYVHLWGNIILWNQN